MKLRTCITTTLRAAAMLAVANPASAKIRVKPDVEVSDGKIKDSLQESMKAQAQFNGAVHCHG